MGAVFRARHLMWNEPRAIKVILQVDREAVLVKTFLAEAWILRQLKHANVVQIEDVDYDDDDRLFIAMEYIEGHDARRVLSGRNTFE